MINSHLAVVQHFLYQESSILVQMEDSIVTKRNPDHLLKILPATVLWRETETVLISNNLKEGDQLIVSDLRVALPGMEVAPQPATGYPEPVTGMPQED